MKELSFLVLRKFDRFCTKFIDTTQWTKRTTAKCEQIKTRKTKKKIEKCITKSVDGMEFWDLNISF